MLRITANDDARVLRFRLEGRLEGPWVSELEKCWKSAMANPGKPSLQVDLTDLTFFDPAGKTLLAAMQAQGAEFVAEDCLTKAVVEEITRTHS